MDWKKLLGEGAKEMLQGAALSTVKEMGKIMLERDALKQKLTDIAIYVRANGSAVDPDHILRLCDGRVSE
jgi:hypothetical protein